MSPQSASSGWIPPLCKRVVAVVAVVAVLGVFHMSSVEADEAVPRDEGPPPPEVVGLLVKVADLDAGLSFYSELFAFEIVGRDHYPDFVELSNGSVELLLMKVERPVRIDYPDVAEAHLNIQIENLKKTLAELGQRQVPLLEDEPRQAAIGPHMPITDPSGNILHVLELAFQEGPLPQPKVFNFGITVTDMGKARTFYCDKLGFDVFSEDYYPPVIPLQKSGTVALVLHESATEIAPVPSPDTAQVNLMIAVADLPAAIRDLRSGGVEFLDSTPRAFPLGAMAAFRDPFGNVHQLFQRR